MSPEDDLEIQRISNIDTQKKHNSLEDVKNSNGSATSNKKNCINLNKVEQNWRSSPLLINGNHHVNHNSHQFLQIKHPISDIEMSHTANNNEWLNTKSVCEMGENKNGWNEILQTDIENETHNFHELNTGKKDQHDTANTLHLEKLAEQDPLTGHIRREPELDELSSCGIGSCQPKWAKMFASTHVFMVVFLLAWILQVNL